MMLVVGYSIDGRMDGSTEDVCEKGIKKRWQARAADHLLSGQMLLKLFLFLFMPPLVLVVIT